MKIGIDIDGVLADFTSPFLKYHNSMYDSSLNLRDVKTFHLSEVLGVSIEEATRRVYDFYETPDFDNLPAIGGAIEEIPKIMKGNELFVITSRKSSLEGQTRRWLEGNFPRAFRVVCFASNYHSGISTMSKEQYCRELKIDVHIEDDLEYAVPCSANGTRVLVFDAPWNECPEEIESINRLTRVFSWREIPPIIKVISSLT